MIPKKVGSWRTCHGQQYCGRPDATFSIIYSLCGCTTSIWCNCYLFYWLFYGNWWAVFSPNQSNNDITYCFGMWHNSLHSYHTCFIYTWNFYSATLLYGNPGIFSIFCPYLFFTLWVLLPVSFSFGMSLPPIVIYFSALSIFTSPAATATWMRE